MKFRCVIVFHILTKQSVSDRSQSDSVAYFDNEVIYG
jgi:hypothetical protein